MTKMSEFGKKVRGFLSLRKVQAVVLAGTGITFLVSNVSAANETFDLTILAEFMDALIGLAPKVGELADAGIPVVIKVAVAVCICAPFVFVAMYLHKKL